MNRLDRNRYPDVYDYEQRSTQEFNSEFSDCSPHPLNTGFLTMWEPGCNGSWRRPFGHRGWICLGAIAAAQFTYKDLYGCDAIIYETLARACQMFDDPPIMSIDAAGTIPQGVAWSLAEGRNQQADISSTLPLNRDLFKDPDRNLADRDNQMAAYVANEAQVKNPFQFADRIYVQVSGTDPREPDLRLCPALLGG